MSSRSKLILGLYFTAAGLAFAASIIDYFKRGELNLSLVAAGIFLALFGFATMHRAKPR